MTPVGSRRSRTRRRTIAAVLAIVACVAVGAGIWALAASRDGPVATDPSTSAGTAMPLPTFGAELGYLITADELRQRADLARDGLEPYRTAVDDLMLEADQALAREPLPENPLTERGGRFQSDTQDAYALALAWTVSGDERYAQRSAEFIMAWVDGVDAISDTCPYAGGGSCATSLLVSRCAPGFVFAATLLEDSDALSVDDDDRLRRWLADLILPAASERINNWGDAGTFMRLAVADYVGDANAFVAAIDHWRGLMDLVTAEGQIPEETRRGQSGLLYTQGAISYKVAAAVIAERRGIDLWSYEGAGGGTLRLAIDSLARYWEDPGSWPWYDGRLRIPTVDPAWELIYHHWPEPAYARIFAADRPFGPDNPSAVIWTTLTHGERLDASSMSTEPRQRRTSAVTAFVPDRRTLPG